MLVDWS